MTFKQIQLGEISDQPWCPAIIRNAVTDFLQYTTNRWGQYLPVLPTLCYFLQKTKARQVVDLCSGGGGPWLHLYGTISRTFGESFRIILTDRYPNLAAFQRAHDRSGGVIDFREQPLEAGNLPQELHGFRTLFGSFHHLSPVQAREVLQNAVNTGQAIGIFEMTDRQPRTLLAMLTAPLFVLLHTPRIRPFRWSRLVFTYLFPIIPLVILIDGLTSCLRSHTLEELTALTGTLSGPPYVWEIKKIKSPRSPFPIISVIGVPGPENARKP